MVGLFLSFIGLSSAPVRADLVIPSTTGELYTACLKVEGNKSMYGEDMFYGGYCLGIIEAHKSELERNCIFYKDDPYATKAAVSSASLTALVQAFVNYAKNNPQDWQMLHLGGLSRAFQQYFPCK